MKIHFVNKIFYPSILTLTILIYSCGGGETKKPRIFEGYPVWMDSVVVSPEKILRGIEPGMSQQEILEKEVIKPSEGDSLYQYYEFKTDSNYTVTFSYKFENKKLDEIEMTIFSDKVEAGNEIFNQLLKYYESKFSKPIEEKGIYVFNATTSAGGTAKVSMEDRSELNKGIIHILVYSEE
ncbi:MAG: hypothetical protein ACK452_08030 [Bacteroidota bacterium]|jgi:hypothetical protein